MALQSQGSAKLLEMSFDRLDKAWEKRYPFMRPTIQARFSAEVVSTHFKLPPKRITWQP